MFILKRLTLPKRDSGRAVQRAKSSLILRIRGTKLALYRPEREGVICIQVYKYK